MPVYEGSPERSDRSCDETQFTQPSPALSTVLTSFRQTRTRTRRSCADLSGLVSSRAGSPGIAGPRDGEPQMLAAQRQAVILDAVRRDGAVRVSDLAERLSVSDMTIRRDLDALSEGGLV